MGCIEFRFSLQVPTWGISLDQGFFGVPTIVRHLYGKDPKRDPDLENYPYGVYGDVV